mgnify:CR=1 FL=1
MLAVTIAEVIDLESMISIASKELKVPVDEVTISTAAMFSALPSMMATISALLTLK